MEIKKKAIFVACILLISVLAGMLLVTEPDTVEASVVIEEHKPELEIIEIEEPEPYGEISIAGQATIECDPDTLVILLSIKYLHPESASKASDEVAKMIDSLLKSLQKLGILKDDISTTSYSINKKYEWTYYENGNRKEQVFKGFEVTCKIKVTTKDFDKGGKVIDAATKNGALVDSINFELSREKRDELKLQVMEMAAKDAKLKAETVITALGENLGHVKSVNLNNYNYQPYKYWDRVNYASIDLDESEIVPPTTILPGDLTVSATVNVVFEII